MFDALACVDIAAWIPHDYRRRVFVDASVTQLHVESSEELGFTYVFCYEHQINANPRRISMPLRRIFSTVNKHWYGNLLVVKLNEAGCVVNVTAADLPAVHAAAFK